MRKSENKTSEKIMMNNLFVLITSTVLLLCVMLFISMGHEMLEQETAKTYSIMSSLKENRIDSLHDWRILSNNSLLNPKTDYLSIYDKTAHGGKTHFYSPNAYKLIHSKLYKLPFFDNIYYSSKFGYLYYVSETFKGIHYHLWHSLKDDIVLMNRILEVGLVVLILVISICIVYTKIIVSKLTKPLNDLALNANKLVTSNKSDDLLCVPANASIEVKNLTENFNQLLVQLHSQNKREKDFISNATHELKTPIATIKSNVQLIKRRGKEHPEVIPKSFEYIEEETNLMQQLINQLLMLSKEKHSEVSKQKINLGNLVKKVVDDIQPTIKQSIQINEVSDQYIFADKLMVNLMITNIINNASKYSKTNTDIHISLVPIKNNIQLKIADEGIGISKEDKQHVFERFYRSQNVRGNVKGNGLGLSLVAQLAKINHIKIQIKDNYPVGTIFVLTFERSIDGEKVNGIIQ